MKLFARGKSGTLHFKFEYQGKTHKRSLETTDPKEGLRRAKLLKEQIKQALIRDRLDELTATKTRKTPDITTTLAQLTAAYETASLDPSPATRRQNIHALLGVVRASLPPSDNLQSENLKITALTADLARAWLKTRRAIAESAPDQATAARTKRTANSLAAQAASLFTKPALEAYRQAGLKLPDFDPFLSALSAGRFRKLKAKAYNPPADTVVTATLAAWPDLPRNEFLAIGLMLAFGLRKGEVAQARWDWLQTREGHPVLTTESGDFKNRTGAICITAVDPWYTTLITRAKTAGWLPPACPPSPPSGERAGVRGLGSENLRSDNLIISGTLTERSEEVFRRVGAFLRQQGWATQKTNHALRDYAGSQIAMKYGLQNASFWLRHSSILVTQTHYTTFVSQLKNTNPDALAARWAIATPAEFIPQILKTAIP